MNDLMVAKEMRDYKGPVYLTFYLPLAPSLEQPASLDMIPRVQSAVDVKTAIENASETLTKIGFDASVLKDAYDEIREQSPDQSLSSDSDEDTSVLNKRQMVRHFEPSSSECLTLFSEARKELRSLNIDHNDWQSGRLGEGVYSLKVTCPGCDFEV
jgi:hypothetical protein